MKKSSMKTKITIMVAIVVAIGFAIMVAVSLNFMESKITDVMVSEFIKEDSQIAAQAEIIMEHEGGTDELQAFVENLTAQNEYIAYAVVIDDTVTAIAHSDTEKIGKNYSDDTGYTVPAATEGDIMTSQFWADVQNAWTYDIMYPIYVNGDFYGSMDIGIYNSTVDEIVDSIRMVQAVVAIIVIAAICVMVGLFISLQLRPLSRIVKVCDAMGSGDFTVEVDAQATARSDEVGRIALAMSNMQTNLSKLIMTTEHHAHKLLEISDILQENANNTQIKASDIAEKSESAVSGTRQQTELTQTNMQMTEEIAKAMEDIAGNISEITATSQETAEEADAGSDKLDTVVDQMAKIEENVNNIYGKIQELAKMSDSIESVVQLIADIASQTNLLALNASIEAARAGEQGKGFAVVAGEVGSLADQSGKATEDIIKIISQIQECITECVKMMEQGNTSVKDGMTYATRTRESFQEIIGKINKVSEDMLSVSAVTEEISGQTTTLCENTDRITNLADSVADNTQQVSGAADEQMQMMNTVISDVSEVSELSDELKSGLAVFKTVSEA